MNDNMKYEDYPESLSKFFDKLPYDKKGSNLYTIETFDINDNLIDTKFGINVITNSGFNKFYHTDDHRKTEYINVVFGNGNGTPAITDTKLFSILPNHPMGSTNGFKETEDVSYIMAEYDPVTNYIYGRLKVATVTLDYNIPNWDDDITITEFGECGRDTTLSNYVLWTHSLVYDSNGNISSFEKKPNEKNVITIYKGSSINCSIFSDMYNQGKYLFINPSRIITRCIQTGYTYETFAAFRTKCFFGGRVRSEDDFPLYIVDSKYSCSPDTTPVNSLEDTAGLFTRGTYNAGFGRIGETNTSIEGENSFRVKDASTEDYCRNTKSMSSIYLKYPTSTVNGARQNFGICGDMVQTQTNMCRLGLFVVHSNNVRSEYYGEKHDCYIFYMEKLNLSEPEEITIDKVWTDSYLTNRLNNCFGLESLFSKEANNKTNSYNYYEYRFQPGIPANDFIITSVKRYNYLTDEYDIDEEFTNDMRYQELYLEPDNWSTNYTDYYTYDSSTDTYSAVTGDSAPTFAENTYYKQIPYDFRNPERAIWGHIGFRNDVNYDVYININTSVPIVGFADTNTLKYTIYASDTFWDRSSYEIISDWNNIPKSLQTKRYYMKTPIDVYNSTDKSMATSIGIHTIRDKNKHSILFSEEPVELNTSDNVPVIENNIDCMFNDRYASDDGWVFVHNYNDSNLWVLYPESSDENGNCYIKPLVSPSITFHRFHVRCTHNSVIIPAAEEIYNNMNYSKLLLKIYRPDPENPDENISSWAYTASEIFPSGIIRADERYVNDYFAYLCIMMLDPIKNRLYIQFENRIRMIDLESSEKNITIFEAAEYTEIFSVIYGTDYLVYKVNDNSRLDFVIIDVTTEETVSTFSIDKTNNMTCNGIFGYNDTIYIEIYDNPNYNVYMYNITTGEITIHLNWYITAFITRDITVSEFNKTKIAFDDEAIVVSSTNTFSSSSKSYRTGNFIIFKDDPQNPVFLSNPIYKDNNNSSWFSHTPNTYADTFGYPYIKKFNEGKDYIAMIDGLVNTNSIANNSCYYIRQPNFINVGLIKNRGLRTQEELQKNCYNPTFNVPMHKYESYHYGTVSSIDQFPEYSKMPETITCFYKDKVLVFSNFMKPMLVPIEYFLPHQVTGTTTTIQAVNNPKHISNSGYFGLEVSNH